MNRLIPYLTSMAVGALALSAQFPAHGQAAMPTAYPTDAPQPGQKATITQSGQGNTALASQMNNPKQTADISQLGKNGKIDSRQLSAGATVSITQTKDANGANAYVDQRGGGGHTAGLVQTGRADATIHQHTGTALQLYAAQNGATKLESEQTGFANFATIQQIVSTESGAAPSTVLLRQLGDNGHVSIDQKAIGGSLVDVLQATGSENASATLKQSGVSNTMIVTQANLNGTLVATQSGDNNTALLRPVNNYHLEVTQTGSRNLLTAGGGAWSSVEGKISQSGSDNILHTNQIVTSYKASYNLTQSGTNNRIGLGQEN